MDKLKTGIDWHEYIKRKKKEKKKQFQYFPGLKYRVQNSGSLDYLMIS